MCILNGVFALLNSQELPEDSAKTAYPGFQMQDPVQQYATSNYAEQDGINAEASNQYPTYYDPTYNGYSGIVPYAAGNVNGYNPAAPNGYNNPGAFAVQTGYEGYLVPAPPQAAATAPKKEVSSRNSISSFFGPFSSAVSALSRSLPESPFNLLLGLLGATVFGGGITTILCTFTPFCSITFPFIGIRSGIKNLAKTYVGPENAELLDKAIEKFSSMQPEERASIAAKSDTPIADSDLKVDAPIAEAPKMDSVEKSGEKSAGDSTTK